MASSGSTHHTAIRPMIARHAPMSGDPCPLMSENTLSVLHAHQAAWLAAPSACWAYVFLGAPVVATRHRRAWSIAVAVLPCRVHSDFRCDSQLGALHPSSSRRRAAPEMVAAAQHP